MDDSPKPEECLDYADLQAGIERCIVKEEQRLHITKLLLKRLGLAREAEKAIERQKARETTLEAIEATVKEAQTAYADVKTQGRAVVAQISKLNDELDMPIDEDGVLDIELFEKFTSEEGIEIRNKRKDVLHAKRTRLLEEDTMFDHKIDMARDKVTSLAQQLEISKMSWNHVHKMRKTATNALAKHDEVVEQARAKWKSDHPREKWFLGLLLNAVLQHKDLRISQVERQPETTRQGEATHSDEGEEDEHEDEDEDDDAHEAISISSSQESSARELESHYNEIETPQRKLPLANWTSIDATLFLQNLENTGLIFIPYVLTALYKMSKRSTFRKALVFINEHIVQAASSNLELTSKGDKTYLLRYILNMISELDESCIKQPVTTSSNELSDESLKSLGLSYNDFGLLQRTRDVEEENNHDDDAEKLAKFSYSEPPKLPQKTNTQIAVESYFQTKAFAIANGLT